MDSSANALRVQKRTRVADYGFLRKRFKGPEENSGLDRVRSQELTSYHGCDT
jgi:predicted hydrolase (HD superfamily)